MSEALSPGFIGRGVRTETVRDLEALALHRPAWDRLAWSAPQEVPTILPGWVDAFLRHRLGKQEKWICCFAYAGDQLIGVLPIVVSPHPLLGLSRPTLRTPFDGNTPSGDVLLASDYAATAFRALLEEVEREVPHHLGIDLRAIRQNSPVWVPLQDCPTEYIMRRGLRRLYSRLDTSGSADTYWSNLGRLRRNLRSSRKKLEKVGDVSIEIRRPSDAEDFLPEYLQLDASGWKGRNGTAIVDDADVLAFYKTLVSNLAAQGQWEWHILRVGERIIAAEMGVRCGRSLILPKYAFDEEFAFCSPGNLLTQEVFSDAFARVGISEINHMSLSDSDHFWRMSQDEYTDVHLIRRSVASSLFYLPWITGQSIYQDYVRPRIPRAVRQAHRSFKRRGDRKPRRAVESRSGPGSTV